MRLTLIRVVGLFHFHVSTLFLPFFSAKDQFFYRSKILLLLSFFACQLTQAQQWSTATNGTDIFNTNTGNIGIGTSTPSFKVDIVSPDNTTATRFRFANTGSSGANAPGSFPTIEILGARGDANNNFQSRLALGTRRTDGTAPLTAQILGSVLFGGQYGTDNNFHPEKILYAASIQGIAEGGFTGSGNMPTGISFLTSSTGSDAGAANAVYGTERMRITNNGNVGIGLSSPGTKLHVWGGDLSVVGTDLNGTAIVTSRAGVVFLGVNSYSNGIAIVPSGNVLIGQTTQVNASYKLDVAGNIRSNKIVVNTTGADFVFDSAYHISPLAEVENYIKRNHHLPGIDPAEQMKKDGLDVGDNQTRLLQKMEELTLYIIELNKKNEQLQQQVTELKTQLDKYVLTP